MIKKISEKIEGFDVEAQKCGSACITYTNKPNTTGPGAIYICEEKKVYGANTKKSK